MVVLLKWRTASSGGPSKVVVPTKYIGRLKWWAPELCPNAHRLCLCSGPLKFNEISFQIFFKWAPWHLRAQGHGPAGPYVNPALALGVRRLMILSSVEVFSVLSLDVTVNDGF